MRSAPQNIVDLLRGEVELLGYEWVGAELTGAGGGMCLRVYIDHEAGINLGDCAQVSHQISGLLDVEDPIREAYQLEVSSPGLDRPLFETKDFERFKGARAAIKTRYKLNNRAKFVGELHGVEAGEILIKVDGVMYRIELDAIDKARLVPDF